MPPKASKATKKPAAGGGTSNSGANKQQPAASSKRKKAAAVEEEALLLAAAEAAAAAAAAATPAAVVKKKAPVKPSLHPEMPAVNAPATPDAKPVKKDLLDLFDACTAGLRQPAGSEGVADPFMWLRRSYASSLAGLHGEAYADFERLVLILGGRVDLPDMQPEPAMALIRCFAAVGNFTRVDQLLPALTQLAGLSTAQRKALSDFVDERKREAAKHSGQLGVPVLLRDRSADRCDAAALSRINVHLTSLVSPAGGAAPLIEVRRSAFGGLGVFAARDVKKDEPVLSEIPTFVGSDPGTTCDRCGLRVIASKCVPCPKCNVTRFCSQQCFAAATEQYHAAVCGIPTRGLEHLVASSTSPSQKHNPLLIRKIFAAHMMQRQAKQSRFLECRPAEAPPLQDACRKFDATHPADDGKLTGDVWMALPLQRGLEEILKSLPPSAMADPCFDFTAVSQLQQVLISNAFGDGTSINLLRAANYFNHSCDPNVNWSRQPGAATFNFAAARPIQRGEELFISYASGTMSIALRQQYGLPSECCVSCTPPS